MLTKQQLDKLNSIIKKVDTINSESLSNQKYLCNPFFALKFKEKLDYDGADRDIPKEMRVKLDAMFKHLKPIKETFEVKGKQVGELKINEFLLSSTLTNNIKKLIRISGDKVVKVKFKQDYTLCFCCKEFDLICLATERIKEEPKPKDNIRIEGYRGSWYVIDKRNMDIIRDGKIKKSDCYLLEHEEYGDEATPLIVDKDLNVLHDSAFDGFDDLEYDIESEAYDLGLELKKEEKPKEDPFKDWTDQEKKLYDFLLKNTDISWEDMISVVIKSNGIIGVGLVTLEEDIIKYIKKFY